VHVFILTIGVTGASTSSERVAFRQRVEFLGNKRSQSFHSSFAFRLHSWRSQTGSSFWKPTVTLSHSRFICGKQNISLYTHDTFREILSRLLCGVVDKVRSFKKRTCS